MKRSKKLAYLFKIARVKTVKGLISKAKTSEAVLEEILTAYRRQLYLCGFLFMLVKIKGEPQLVSADNPQWRSMGFSDLTDEEYKMLQLLADQNGYAIAITEDGILCCAPVERIHPLAQPVRVSAVA